MDPATTTVTTALRRKIAAEGPIAFEVFQDIALYGDGGFFASGPLRSTATGDFLTSPEVSPWFGKTIARFVDQQPASIDTVIEVGAGSGSLLSKLMEQVSREFTAWAVEASPMARQSLAQLLPEPRVVDSLTALPSGLSAVLIANELIDNLPVSLAVRRGTGWSEHFVDYDGVFSFVEVPARPEVARWAEEFGGNVPEGGIVEVQLAATQWLDSAIGLLASGTIVLIDYGGTVEELEPRRQLGTLRTYRGHHLGPDPLLEPGETDITVDVNFTALVDLAERRGARVALQRQDDFLAEWDLRSVVKDLKLKELESARSGDTVTQLTVRSERVDAETLLHPRGLGDFRVLIIDIGVGSWNSSQNHDVQPT